MVADAKRRTFTAEYKQRILAEADAAANPGASAPCSGARGCTLRTSRMAARAGPRPGSPQARPQVQTRCAIGGNPETPTGERSVDRTAGPKPNSSSMFKKKSRRCWGGPWRRSTATRTSHERRRPGCPWFGFRRYLYGPRRFPRFFASAAGSATPIARASAPAIAASRADWGGARHRAGALTCRAISRPFAGRGLRDVAGRRRLLLFDPHAVPHLG